MQILKAQYSDAMEVYEEGWYEELNSRRPPRTVGEAQVGCCDI